MGKHSCIKIELNDITKYSSPMPVIGLYIAAASLVCFLAMSYDIISGFRHRKKWLPCRLFSLNSVTLILLSIAAKIPVDLTTAMPSAQDQISKLTGTTLICICMGFLTLSLGTIQKSECFTNMSALSILVVTVTVNISIQIGTGVIFMFITEHLIILICMTLLLIFLWLVAFEINILKDDYLDRNIDHFTKGQGSLLEKLKLTYVYGYNSNPQFLLCKNFLSHIVSMICLTCLVVLVQAALRSLTLEFCRGVSDYDWSMWIIITTQILTIVVGGFATSFRWFVMSRHTMLLSNVTDVATTEMINSNPLLASEPSSHDLWTMPLVAPLFVPLFVVELLVVPNLFVCYDLVADVLGHCFGFEYKDDKDTEEYKHLIQESGDKFGLDEWSLRKSVMEMKRSTGVSQGENLNNLSEILLRRLDPYQQLQTMELEDQVHSNQEGIHVSSLSIVLLVAIVEICIPFDLRISLCQSYNESRQLVQFIDKNILVGLKNRKRSRLAEAVWKGPGFISLLPKIFESDNEYATRSDLDRALVIIKELTTAMPSDIVSDEVGVITNFIGRREYLSTEDLYNFIEQMFVDMMLIILARFPHAVFNEVFDSPPEEFDERIGRVLHFLCQVKLLKAPIQWSFPAGCDISSLADDQAPDAQNQVDNMEEPTVDNISHHVIENVDNAFHITVNDEIIPV